MTAQHATYQLQIDWDGDGSFESGDEDVTSRLYSVVIDRGFASPLARVAQVGRMTVVLDNASRRYSPYSNADVLPRRQVRFQMTYSSTTEILFRGFIESIEPTADLFGARLVTIECVDAQVILDMVPARMAIANNVTADQIIDVIVDAAYTPPGTAYDAGITVFPWAGDRWKLTDEFGVGYEEVSAGKKIEDVCISDWGRFFVAGNGYPTYRNRHNMILNTTAALTLSNTMTDLKYRKAASEVYNVVDVTCHPRTVGTALEVLGRMQNAGKPKIEAGGAQTFLLDFRDPSDPKTSVGAYGLITPVAGTDFEATSDEAGEGTDLTASVTPTMTGYGDRAEVTLTNGAGQIVYVQALKVRGYAVRVREEVTMTDRTTASETAYNSRKLPISAPLMNEPFHAYRLAQYLLDQYDTPRDVVTGVRFRANADATRMAAARDLDLLDRVVLTEGQTGLSSYAGYIYRLRHEISGRRHWVTFDLETAVDVGTPFRLSISALNSGHLLVY